MFFLSFFPSPFSFKKYLKFLLKTIYSKNRCLSLWIGRIRKLWPNYCFWLFYNIFFNFFWSHIVNLVILKWFLWRSRQFYNVTPKNYILRTAIAKSSIFFWYFPNDSFEDPNLQCDSKNLNLQCDSKNLRKNCKKVQKQ